MAALKPVDIVYKLKKKGLTQRALADQLGVSHGLVSNVIHNRTTCYPVATRIADLLGKDVQALFPGRYQFKPRARKAQSADRARVSLDDMEEEIVN